MLRAQLSSRGEGRDEPLDKEVSSYSSAIKTASGDFIVTESLLPSSIGCEHEPIFWVKHVRFESANRDFCLLLRNSGCFVYLNLEIPVVVAKAVVRTRQLVTGDFDFENRGSCCPNAFKLSRVDLETPSRTYLRTSMFVRTHQYPCW